MAHRNTMLKVLSPVESKNGKTFWIRIGSAFINRDGSTNVYLNAYPTSGKLHIREFDDRDMSGQPEPSRQDFEERAHGATEQDDLPF